MSSGTKIPPVPIENRIKDEIPFVINVMVVGDERQFLTCLMTLKVYFQTYIMKYTLRGVSKSRNKLKQQNETKAIITSSVHAQHSTHIFSSQLPLLWLAPSIGSISEAIVVFYVFLAVVATFLW